MKANECLLLTVVVVCSIIMKKTGRAKVMNCSNCGSNYPDEGKFCPNCGTPNPAAN